MQQSIETLLNLNMILIEKNIDRLKIICSAHNVDKMYLFGSALNSNFNDNSDIDFLVKFNHLNYLSTSIII
jgi:predicted nucleotidyltransferase